GARTAAGGIYDARQVPCALSFPRNFEQLPQGAIPGQGKTIAEFLLGAGRVERRLEERLNHPAFPREDGLVVAHGWHALLASFEQALAPGFPLRLLQFVPRCFRWRSEDVRAFPIARALDPVRFQKWR